MACRQAAPNASKPGHAQVAVAPDSEIKIDPEFLSNVGAVQHNINSERTADQKVPVHHVAQMSAPGIKSGYQMRPPEGSDMQVAEHNRIDLDKVAKPNGPFGATA